MHPPLPPPQSQREDKLAADPIQGPFEMDPCIMQIVSLCHEKAPINTLRVPLQKYILPYPTYRQLWLCSPRKQIHKCWTYEVDICEFVCVWDEGESYWNERNAKKFSKTPHLSLAAAAFKSKLEMDSDQGRQEHLFSSKHGNFQRKQFLKYESKCCLAKQWSVQPHCSQCIVTGHTQMKNNRKTKHRRISRHYQRFM